MTQMSRLKQRDLRTIGHTFLLLIGAKAACVDAAEKSSLLQKELFDDVFSGFGVYSNDRNKGKKETEKENEKKRGKKEKQNDFLNRKKEKANEKKESKMKKSKK